MALTINDRAPWTADAVADLIHMVRAERLSNSEIADRTGRGLAAIYTAVSRYAIRAEGDEVKERVCMPCRKPFLSLHKHNRICGMCKEHNRELECA